MKLSGAVSHLALWGGLSGWISAAIMLFLLNFLQFGGMDFITASALFGGMSGIIVGVLCGLALDWYLRQASQALPTEHRSHAEELIGSLSLLGMILASFVFQLPFGIAALYSCIIPVSLIFATGHYMQRVQILAADAEKQKRDASHLEDKFKHDEDEISSQKEKARSRRRK